MRGQLARMARTSRRRNALASLRLGRRAGRSMGRDKAARRVKYHNGGFIVVPHGSREEAHLEEEEDCLGAMDAWDTEAEVAMHQDNIIKAYDDLVAKIKTDLQTMNKYYRDHKANYICEFPYLAYRPKGYVLPGPANRNLRSKLRASPSRSRGVWRWKRRGRQSRPLGVSRNPLIFGPKSLSRIS